MYAQLNADYKQLALSLNIFDKMNEKLTEEHSWTDCNNPLHLKNVDPASLDTPEKRKEVYDDFLNNNPYTGLYRTTPYEFRVQLHPNLLLAKVEHWIREALQAQAQAQAQAQSQAQLQAQAPIHNTHQVTNASGQGGVKRRDKSQHNSRVMQPRPGF